MNPTDTIVPLIERLTGQDCPLEGRIVPDCTLDLLSGGGSGLGHSQFNELLLTLGYDRVTHVFFQWLVDGSTEYKANAAFHSLKQLQEGIDRFRKIGALEFGNIKFAFKRWSFNADDFLDWLYLTRPVPEEVYKNRHDPIHPIQPIPGDQTYYLGYIIEGELKARLAAAKEAGQEPDPELKKEEAIWQSTIAIGKRNFEAYLVSDHLDVYVATSMRTRHEYQMVHKLTNEIFAHKRLSDLKVRYFDPTQAYCLDPIDKGISEALMLKRAACTIYFVQETDTIGKDSELASTLAQGKPVIAYVPDPPSDYAEKTLIPDLIASSADKDVRNIILSQLKIFEPDAPWTAKDAKQIRRWMDEPNSFDQRAATARLQAAITKKYSDRAKMLQHTHPLRIQVNLDTGVANGVLVVRDVDHCAELVRRVLLHELEFVLEEGAKKEEGTDKPQKPLYLKETVSQSIFRVVSGDKLLTNSFWNFYLSNPIERSA
jgi:hypothetical protein